MQAKGVHLKPHDIETVERAGKLTFKPVSGGRLRCNQLPHLGKLTEKQADYLRNQCNPRRNAPEAESAQFIVKNIPEVSRTRGSFQLRAVPCPHCRSMQPAPVGTVTCGYCQRKFRVV